MHRTLHVAASGVHGTGVETSLGTYCLVVGALMVVWWCISIRGGALTRSDRSRVEVVLHLTAELLTAALLVVGGLIVLVDGTALVAASGLGMLLYTVIASSGYFLARGERAPVVMFAVLTILTVGALVAVWTTVGQHG